MEKRLIKLWVNGEPHEIGVNPNDTLLEVLRDRIGLIGAKEGCGVGECGACTVLMEGRPVLSCIILAMDADGSGITTVEGISTGEEWTKVETSGCR